MAEQNRRQPYPYVPERNWWDLRKRFKQSPPSQVTASYLQSVLNLKEPSAKQLLAPLRLIGLIDENGRPTELAHDWRSDEHYSAVCQRIVDLSYPQELRDAFPGTSPDRKGVENWFMRDTKTGQANAGKLASFYVLLNQADLSAQEQVQTNTRKKERTASSSVTARTRAAAGPRPVVSTVIPDKEPVLPQTDGRVAGVSGPSIHIDVQIHIAADARPEQIDQIFASMAKRLGLGNSD